MEKSYLFSSTFNNIVFNGRNKAYGAYVLRRRYGRHMTLAAVLATVSFTGVLVAPLLQSMIFGEPEKYVKPVYEIHDPFIIELPPAPEVKPPKEAATPPVTPPKPQEKQAAYTETKIVKDDAPEPTTELATQKELKAANIGTKNVDGIAPEMPSVSLPDAPPAGLGTGAGTGEAEGRTKPFITVDNMPAFPGGDAALFKYLSKNITYPGAAKQAGVEGLVVVTFVVAANGEIQDVQILKGLGYGTEEEAMRVVKKMPLWSPGSQNGQKVPVRYTLPIRFNLK